MRRRDAEVQSDTQRPRPSTVGISKRPEGGGREGRGKRGGGWGGKVGASCPID